MADGQLILIAGALLAAGLLASLAAGRLRIPGLVLFLGVGMVVGSDGTGWLAFEDYGLARSVGVVALALILFEGGLASGIDEIRPVLGPAIGLALVGTLGTALIVGLAAAWLFGFSTLEGLLLGSVVASTDGAATFALLRGSTLRRKLAQTLEGEAGLNDPLAVLLVVGFIDWIERPGYDLADMAGLFAEQVGIGLVVGAAVGGVAVHGFRRVQLATAGLYPVAAIATAALSYGGAATLGGSGFLAVYVAGLGLGSAAIPARQTVAAFHQGLAWVAQITLFVVLGLLVFPSQLPGVAVEGTALALILMFVARPLAVVLATGLFDYTGRERAVLGWAGLRGAVPVVLATFPVIAHVHGSLEFFNVVFFVVLLSTIVQGTTFEPLARRLRLTTSQPALPQPLTEAGTIRRLGAEVLEYTVASDDAVADARISDLGLPRDAVVNVIVRGDEAIPPRGSTRLRAGDVLHVLVRVESGPGRARPDRPLAYRTDRPPTAAGPADDRAGPDLFGLAMGRSRRRPSAAGTNPRPGNDRAAAQPPGRARGALGAGRRALGDQRAAGGGGRPRGADEVGGAPAGVRRAGRASLAANSDRSDRRRPTRVGGVRVGKAALGPVTGPYFSTGGRRRARAALPTATRRGAGGNGSARDIITTIA